MLGNFSYCNPTKLYFGKKSLNYLNDELSKYGKNVVLIYGGGSIKKNGIYDAVTALLKEKEALDVINEEIIPALDHVGKGFEKGTVFLPQLLMSAEAAKAAFEVIKNAMAGSGET